jgi:hypothetical protein
MAAAFALVGLAATRSRASGEPGAFSNAPPGVVAPAPREAIVGAFGPADPEPPRVLLGVLAPDVGATVLPELPFATTDGVLVTV